MNVVRPRRSAIFSLEDNKQDGLFNRIRCCVEVQLVMDHVWGDAKTEWTTFSTEQSLPSQPEIYQVGPHDKHLRNARGSQHPSAQAEATHCNEKRIKEKQDWYTTGVTTRLKNLTHPATHANFL